MIEKDLKRVPPIDLSNLSNMHAARVDKRPSMVELSKQSVH